MAIERYVDTGSTAGGNGTTAALSGANRAYVSLAAWNAAEQVDLVTSTNQHIVHCNGATADVQCTVNGWTTNATYFITIQVDQSLRHNGAWSTGAYRIDISSVGGAGCLRMIANYTQLIGLQLRTSSTGPERALSIEASNSRTINCILRAEAAVSSKCYDSEFCSGGQLIRNTLAYGGLVNFKLWGTGSTYVYNCGAADGTFGIRSIEAGTTAIVKNSWSKGNSSTDFIVSLGTITPTYCASGDATADDWGGTGNRINQTFGFVSASDFHLLSSDTACLDLGTDLSGDANQPFSDDIDGVARTGTWDIGPDEYVAAGVAPMQPTSSMFMRSNI